MLKGEKSLLTVKPRCKSQPLFSTVCHFFEIPVLYCSLSLDLETNTNVRCLQNLYPGLFADGFGSGGKAPSGDVKAIPAEAVLEIELELVSWKVVEEVTDDKKVLKKILIQGEGYEKPNEGSVVKCIYACTKTQ